ncbi:DUF2303 family protein [Algiphilus sp.]|uniref:DUF2303 family protein n=1 Tax=Algiphilus sp. TaxID=1872431 RepID=UPI003CCBA3AE
MEAQAIQEIKRLALAAEGKRDLGTHRPALVIDGSVVDIEHLQAGRSRFRGKFNTNVLSEYVNYIGAHENQAGACFVDADSMTSTTFLNLGDDEDPGHADWTAKLKLAPTAGYEAVQTINGRPQSQRDLVEWVEDWAPYLTAESNGESITTTQAITSLRQLTIEQIKKSTHEDRDFGAARTAMEDIEARANGQMPTHFLFTVVPYLGFRQRTLRLRISVLSSDDRRPALSLRIVGYEQLVEDLAVEFKELLIDNIGDAASVAIGTFSP